MTVGATAVAEAWGGKDQRAESLLVVTGLLGTGLDMRQGWRAVGALLGGGGERNVCLLLRIVMERIS